MSQNGAQSHLTAFFEKPLFLRTTFDCVILGQAKSTDFVVMGFRAVFRLTKNVTVERSGVQTRVCFWTPNELRGKWEFVGCPEKKACVHHSSRRGHSFGFQKQKHRVFFLERKGFFFAGTPFIVCWLHSLCVPLVISPVSRS